MSTCCFNVKSGKKCQQPCVKNSKLCRRRKYYVEKQSRKPYKLTGDEAVVQDKDDEEESVMSFASSAESSVDISREFVEARPTLGLKTHDDLVIETFQHWEDFVEVVLFTNPLSSVSISIPLDANGFCCSKRRDWWEWVGCGFSLRRRQIM
eukprot:Hpha_TRINITY_DN13451_c0_g1::TRINITY_DN13451_c0_g1_i1::g.131237::m.131237